ncbi:beta-glucosidase-like [Raphidocelis subcapitata]|uniref:Beta-glucosidase-like n=1 Tax=Raphidocelis subcapitata TaxID=307507 RepID=A0A2V0P2I5_9CHLO|nr:beta-glucosidase-like [Raphidocelis subcapitata]|eukprot:GBF94088.1 beta-glucosidase-like [Raphidocelis subcapitata]
MAALAPLLAALLVAAAAASAQAEPAGAPDQCTPDVLSRIAFGAGVGSYQTEGSAQGRAPTIWDTFSAASPSKIADGSNAKVAADFVRRYKGDVQLMRQLKMKHFRFSISWARLLPGAKSGSAPDAAAAAYYSSLIDELLAAGIQPLVVLYQWDLPQSLQDDYDGFLSPKIVPDFVHFADTAFRLFGDRVKTWLTFIEPAVFCNQQYGSGIWAPGVANGEAGRFACGKHVLLAHAAAAAAYNSKYRAAQNGALSFSTLVTWAEPASGSEEDAAAAQNKLDADVGWFLDPIFKGDYPASLRAAKGDALPPFTPSEAASLRGSLDFVAANCFTARFVSAGDAGKPGAWRESKVSPVNGSAVGAASGLAWLDVAPWGQGRALAYLQMRYGDPQLFISSSGVMAPGENKLQGAAALKDAFRTDYYRSYLNEVCRAARGGARVIGWSAWSFMDAWEWTEGFNTKFGIVHVDYSSPSLERAPKASALWLAANVFSRGAPAVAHAA